MDNKQQIIEEFEKMGRSMALIVDLIGDDENDWVSRENPFTLSFDEWAYALDVYIDKLKEDM